MTNRYIFIHCLTFAVAFIAILLTLWAGSYRALREAEAGPPEGSDLQLCSQAGDCDQPIY